MSTSNKLIVLVRVLCFIRYPKLRSISSPLANGMRYWTDQPISKMKKVLNLYVIQNIKAVKNV